MGSGGAVSDAWEVLANIGGNSGYLGSCTLEALPHIQGVRWLLGSPWWPLLFLRRNRECLDHRFVIVLARRGHSD
jgi:hypothetical protein